MAENNSFAPLKTAEGAYPALPASVADVVCWGDGKPLDIDWGAGARLAGGTSLYTAEQMHAYATQAVAAQAPAAVAVPTDFELRERWRAAGGSFHGPCVETGTMPEAQLLPFLRELAATPAEMQPTPSQVLAITTAYEQGVGKGHDAYQRGVEIANPYCTSNYQCFEAWRLGYKEGKTQAARKAEVPDMTVADHFPHEQMDALALARYKVVPSDQSMYWRHAVVAGDGQQHLYNGREVDCQNMARKFAGAFLDGAFVFHSRHAAPQAQPAALDAARYRHLRDNCVREWVSRLEATKGKKTLDIEFAADGHDLDAAIDAAMAAAQDKRRILYTSPVATQGEKLEAKRYRYLRETDRYFSDEEDGAIYVRQVTITDGVITGSAILTDEELDAAIDAALSATTPPVATTKDDNQ